MWHPMAEKRMLVCDPQRLFLLRGYWTIAWTLLEVLLNLTVFCSELMQLKHKQKTNQSLLLYWVETMILFNTQKGCTTVKPLASFPPVCFNLSKTTVVNKNIKWNCFYKLTTSFRSNNTTISKRGNGPLPYNAYTDLRHFDRHSNIQTGPVANLWLPNLSGPWMGLEGGVLKVNVKGKGVAASIVCWCITLKLCLRGQPYWSTVEQLDSRD